MHRVKDGLDEDDQRDLLTIHELLTFVQDASWTERTDVSAPRTYPQHRTGRAYESFGVECSDGIEARRAQRRDIAGGERDSGKYKRDARERGQIGRRHAVEQSGH